MPARRRTAAALVLVALAGVAGVLGGACGDDGGDGNIVTARPDTTTTALSSSVDFATTKVSTPPAERGLLTNVTTVKGKQFTRIVFEFRDALPGYSVDYTRRPIVQDGSGDEVEIVGDEVLLVHLEPASGFDLAGRSGEGQATYTGPKRITVGGNSDPVQEVVQVGDFEARLRWAIGVTGKRPFRVSTATDPPALLVDVQALDGD